MSFSIPKEQQKAFVDEFLTRVLDLALQMVEKEEEGRSPGEMVKRIADPLIQEIVKMGPQNAEKPHNGKLDS